MFSDSYARDDETRGRAAYGARVSGADHDDAPAVAAMRHAPTLALLSAAAAMLDLGVNKIAVRLVDTNARAIWLPLVQHGRLLRNLACLAGVLVLFVSLSSLVRVPSPSHAPWRGVFARASLAAIAGLYTPSILVALFTPREHVPGLVVVLGLLGGNALVASLGATSLSYRRVGPAWASMLAGLTATLAMVGMLVASLRTIVPVVGTIGLACRHGAELGWLLTPLPLLFDRALHARLRAHRGHAALAVVVALGVLVLGLALQQGWRDDSARIAYGAFRVAMLTADRTWLYAVPVGLALGLAVAHLAWPDRRQLGIALLFWVAAGLAPRTPSGTLYEVLAALLLARSALVTHPAGRARLLATDPLERASR